jgi:AraC-like DNA-binding protein
VVGTGFGLSNLGPVGEAMLAAPTAGKAIRLLCDALHAVQSASSLTLSVEHNTAIVRYQILDPMIWPRNQDAELTLGVVSGLMQRARGGDWRPDSLVFEHPSVGPLDRGKQWSRNGVGYARDTNEIRFPAVHLDTPMPTRDTQLYRELAVVSARLGHERKADTPVPGLVRQAIFRRLGEGPGVLDQTEIARSLGLSRRSLRRRLADFGTSYSQELLNCRLGAAQHRLLHSALSVSDIAYELDYSDQTAFERAFRRATGMTPTRFRRQQLHDCPEMSGQPNSVGSRAGVHDGSTTAFDFSI